MKLGNRLSLILDRIPKCDCVADIGTDHGYIPIAAVRKGLCAKAVASDVRVGPIRSAQKNIDRYGLQQSISTRLGNGLENVTMEESDVIVIAGMGGQLIREIMEAAPEKAQKASLLLLQPNNAQDALRKYLSKTGFEIHNEALALDMEKLYTLMSVRWTGVCTEMDAFGCYIGEKLLENKDLLLERYLVKKLKELDKVIHGRAKSARLRQDPEMEPVTQSEEIIQAPDQIPRSVLSELDNEACIALREKVKAALAAVSGSAAAPSNI